VTDPRATTFDEHGRLIVRSHAGVVGVARNPAGFSNAVSAHLQVPNGLDGEAHARTRRLLDPFLASREVDALEPELDRLAGELVSGLRDRPFDAVADLGARYAVRAQSAWLGWDTSLEDDLLAWVADNRAATRAGDSEWMSRVAARFDALVRGILDDHRAHGSADATCRLIALRTDEGEALRDAELVSILRNWTGGDLSSLALCAGVVVHALAADPSLQHRMAEASDRELDLMIDELLRLDDPFVSNRRRSNADAVVDGCPVAEGGIVVLDWRAANRDREVFSDEFAPHAHAQHNLVWGTGPHVCPGRGLATRELRVLVRAIVRAGTVVLTGAPVREVAPVAGFRSVPVRIEAPRLGA
jgi:cytochrome P450